MGEDNRAGGGKSPNDLDEAADLLYGFAPNEFVAARDELAASLRTAGRNGLASAVKRLRKPTVGAWAINLLARLEPDRLDTLLRLGPALGKAQRLGRRDELRSLSQARVTQVNALVKAATTALENGGHRMTSDVALDIESTIAGALADPAIADQVRSGRLDRPVQYAGLGPAPGLRLVPPVTEGADGAELPDEQPPEPALPDLDELAAEYETANTRHADAIAAADQVDEERTRLRVEYDNLRSRLQDLETKLRECDRAANEALREVGRADRDLQRAKRAFDKAHDAHARAAARRR